MLFVIKTMNGTAHASIEIINDDDDTMSHNSYQIDDETHENVRCVRITCECPDNNIAQGGLTFHFVSGLTTVTNGVVDWDGMRRDVDETVCTEGHDELGCLYPYVDVIRSVYKYGCEQDDVARLMEYVRNMEDDDATHTRLVNNITDKMPNEVQRLWITDSEDLAKRVAQLTCNVLLNATENVSLMLLDEGKSYSLLKLVVDGFKQTLYKRGGWQDFGLAALSLKASSSATQNSPQGVTQEHAGIRWNFCRGKRVLLRNMPEYAGIRWNFCRGKRVLLRNMPEYAGISVVARGYYLGVPTNYEGDYPCLASNHLLPRTEFLLLVNRSNP